MNTDNSDQSDKEAEAMTTSTEINFEDIKVSNVSQETKDDDESMEEKSTVLSTTDTFTSLSTITATTSSTTSELNPTATVVTSISAVTPKIVQKLTTSAATTVTKSNSGQVVIIQRPSGTSVPIRIAAPGTLNQGSNQNKPVTIQVLKMADGSFVQIKNNKALNLTNLSNVAHMNIGTKKGTNGQNQSIIIKSVTGSPSVTGTSQTKVITSSATIGAQLLKSVSSIDNQKITTFSKAKIVENFKPFQKTTINQNNSSDNAKSIADNINVIASTNTNTATTTTTVSSSSSSPSTTATKSVLQKLVTSENKDMTMKSENDSSPKQIIVPHHVLKLSPSSGSVQTIQIPGKSGLQYVRVLGPAASTASTSSTTTNSNSEKLSNNTITISPSKDISSTNVTATAPVSSGQKIILNTKARQNSSSIILNKDTILIPHSSSSTIKMQSSKSILTTFPTLKKIAENGKGLTLLKKSDSEKISSNQSQEKYKITQINRQLHNLTSQSNKISNGQKITSNKTPQLFMVSKEFLKKMQSGKDNEKNVEIITTKSNSSSSQKKLFSVLKPNHQDSDSSVAAAVATNDSNISISSTDERCPSSPTDGPRRKHCNCTKSQCLKLYCDCFANGEFCQDCNCKECLNNLENESERQKAIQICLERNPNAFKPKITKARDQSDLRLHNKGCNCKRSGCLKNYCECYEAKIVCSSNCKCLGCRNVEDRSDIDQSETTKITQRYGSGRGCTLKRSYDLMEGISGSPEPINKQAYNFITEDVVDATVQCMFAQTDECKKSEINAKNSERMIIEELGRCLVEIIDFSIRNMDG